MRWKWLLVLALLPLAVAWARRGRAMAGRMAQVDAAFGPLRPGREYVEGTSGRIMLTEAGRAWERANIVRVALADGRTVRLHRRVAADFAAAYAAALESGYKPQSVQTYVARHMGWDHRRPLSMHAYGLAVDIDPKVNAWGKPRGAAALDAPAGRAFVAAMRAGGWRWGGDWRTTRDPMHFEWGGL